MTDQPRTSGERNSHDQAPELHNSEQDDELDQAQSVADDALRGESHRASPLDSIKGNKGRGDVDDSTQDLIDHMRDMEQSGRIDMRAFSGEPNHDDNEDKYGDEAKLDDLPSEGASDERFSEDDADDSDT